MTNPELLRIPEKFHNVNDALETAKMLNLTNVIILSEKENGETIYLEAGNITVAKCNWMLDKMKRFLLS